jgi:hypothetical protein
MIKSCQTLKDIRSTALPLINVYFRALTKCCTDPQTPVLTGGQPTIPAIQGCMASQGAAELNITQHRSSPKLGHCGYLISRCHGLLTAELSSPYPAHYILHISAIMPGTPSSRGCDGCRRQKKKVSIKICLMVFPVLTAKVRPS